MTSLLILNREVLLTVYDEETLLSSEWPEPEVTPLLEALRLTLEKHPELVPSREQSLPPSE